MDKPIIEVKNLGKRYKIAHMRGGYIALRDVLANIIKHPLRFATAKARQATGLSKKEEFWALRGVSFSIRRGEVIGVIGQNGAGKSTLLKILSQITPPTEGEVILRGRVGSLLEVGTGFHPELTGRENIFLNGAILGMKRREIAAKFDEIVAFAGIERFLDTPVKFYSSGMYVRLAFSVAAHMEPDILLVDEVLAVGDAEFQKKCLGKMDEITKKEGRTIFFVSHNMAALKSLCPKAILLERGTVKEFGPTAEVIERYLKNIPEGAVIRRGDDKAVLIDCAIVDKDLHPIESAYTDEKVGIKMDLEILDDATDIFPNFSLHTADETVVMHSLSDLPKLKAGKHSIVSWIPANLLNSRRYRLKLAIMSSNPRVDHAIQEVHFEIKERARTKSMHDYMGEIHGVVRPQTQWVEL